MFTVFISLMALQTAQTAPPPQYKTPTVRAVGCRCRQPLETADIILEGLVIDAEVTLAPGGRSVNDRMATVFHVKGDGKISGRTKVWHSSDANQCGVTFDYGLTYKVAARKNEDGQLETDECLMRSLRPEANRTQP